MRHIRIIVSLSALMIALSFIEFIYLRPADTNLIRSFIFIISLTYYAFINGCKIDNTFIKQTSIYWVVGLIVYGIAIIFDSFVFGIIAYVIYILPLLGIEDYFKNQGEHGSVFLIIIPWFLSSIGYFIGVLFHNFIELWNNN